MAAPLCADEAISNTASNVIPEALSLTADPSTLEPGLKFEHETFDYGTIDQGEKITVEFPFKNTSDRTITIDSIRASCGCTVPVLDKKVYAPGESEIIKATFDSARRQGVNTKTVTVRTDDAAQAEYKLSFKGNVQVSVFLKDPVLQIKDLDEGTEFSSDTYIVNMSGADVKILSVSPTKAGIEVTTGTPEPYTDADSNRTGQRIPVKILIPETMPAGPLDGSVEFTTDNNNVPRLSLPVRGQILGDLVANPPQLFFGNPQPGTEETRRIILTAKKGKKFTYESSEVTVTQGSGKPTVSIIDAEAPIGRPNSQAMDITLLVPDESGYLVGDLTLIGTLDDKPHRLTVPYKLLVRPAASTTSDATTNPNTSKPPITIEARDAKIEEMRQQLKERMEKERQAREAAKASAESSP